ncbi:MAG: UbiA family prenyltransferase, partial [Pseudomonadota bacterium]
MSTTTAEINDSAIIRDLWQLLKPKIMLLVVVTAIAAMLISPVYNLAHPIQLVLTILAIALGSGGASAFNMWYDRDIDKIMSRTKQRPIPSGRINSDEALAFSLISISASIILMFIASNTKATWMLLFSIFYYTVIYTILLKRHTVQNIVIG